MIRGSAFLDQTVPIIVTALMTEMSQESPVRFMKLYAAFFAFGVVRLGDIDDDDPVLMAGEGFVAAKFEGETVPRVNLAVQ